MLQRGCKMKVLYLSHLCSTKEYERMFRVFGTTTSHAAQKFHRLMVEGLRENECAVDVLTQRILARYVETELTRPQESEDGICYTYLPCTKGKNWNCLNTIVSAFKKICEWHKKYPDGVVICDTILGEMSLALWLASRFYHIKTVGLVTDVPSIFAGETRTGFKAIPFKIKNAIIYSYKSYIFLTEQMNQILNPHHRPYVVIEGIVDRHVVDIPNTLKGKYSNKVCIMAGQLEKFFGVDMLIQAFRQINCPDAELRFYGYGTSVETIKAAEKIDPRIHFCGQLTNEQMVQEERCATLMINPRTPEGKWTVYSFPSKNMEYIASGTPMLANKLPCIPDEYLPYFYYPEEPSHFTQKLQEVLQCDQATLHVKGLEAQSWIVRTKNAKEQVRKLSEMLQTL